jgi:hypothetical protein
MNLLLRPSLRARRRTGRAAYLLTEVLVYISLLFVVLGAAYVALYRFMDHSIALRQNADDITAALHAGERWRADVRASTNAFVAEIVPGEIVLFLQGSTQNVDYCVLGGALFRRVNPGPWTRFLPHVKSSTMTPQARGAVNAWAWELELQPRARIKTPSRVKPLFTFLAVPHPNPGL